MINSMIKGVNSYIRDNYDVDIYFRVLKKTYSQRSFKALKTCSMRLFIIKPNTSKEIFETIYTDKAISDKQVEELEKNTFSRFVESLIKYLNSDTFIKDIDGNSNK